MTAVLARGLHVRYGSTQALTECDLEVPEGVVTALVGANGAGKSTLLHCVVGLTLPTRGEVIIFEEAPAGSNRARQRVAFVAQDAPLYKNLSVRRTLDLTASLNRVFDRPFAEQRLRELGTAPNEKVGQLSLGQQAQVALTLALARHPELLVLDEPLARLDPVARHDFIRLMLAATVEEGISVIYSTHVLGEVRDVADYLVVLAGGAIRVARDVEEFLNEHVILSGPRGQLGQLSRFCEVLRIRHGSNTIQVLVRLTQGRDEIPGAWELEDVYLEELILAYLDEPAALAAPETLARSRWSMEPEP